MTDNAALNLNSAENRALNYGRLAQAFTYPEKGHKGLLAAVDYTEAFDRAASGRACSLREYEYRKDIHPTSLNEELLRFYHFFGLSRAGDAVMPDHIAVECEFMQFLSTLESAAAERGDDVTPLKKAQRDFLHRHLCVLSRGIHKALRVDNPACHALVELAVNVTASDLHRLEEEVGLADDAAA